MTTNIAKPTDFKIDITADLNRWRTFLVIGELRSLTRAAAFLDCDQSLLSRQLNALERECRARLFNRTGRGVELSEVGARLFPRVKSLLADAEVLENEIRDGAQEPTGRVTLGLLPSIATTLVGKLFSEIRHRYPGVSLRIFEGSSGQVQEWLADSHVDIAILYRYGSSLPEMEQALAVVDNYLIGPAGDKLTAAPEVEFSALHELPFILPSAPNGLRTALDSIARQQHINLTPVIEANSLPLQRMLVATEGLYTVLPLHSVWHEVADGRLQAARIVGTSLQPTVSMAMSKSKGPAKAVSITASQIMEIVGEMARAGMWRPSTSS